MAVYCSKCGAEMGENDAFCGKCGAPAAKPAAKPASPAAASGAEAQKYRMIGIAVVAVVVLAVLALILKGFGGGKSKDSEGQPGQTVSGEDLSAGNGTAEGENDVVAHLTPWMGEWVKNYLVYENQGSGLLHNFDNEGQYQGHIFDWQNNTGWVHINEQYIDFTDLTKNQKDRYPVANMKYYVTDYGAEAFEDPDTGIRFIFYSHFHTYEESQDYGEVMNIQAYVGTEEPDINYWSMPDGSQIPMGFTGHYPGPDGWAVEISGSFVRVPE